MNLTKPKKTSPASSNRMGGNSLLFVLSFICSAGSFGLVQASTGNTIVANITVGYFPVDAVVSPNNSTLYVASDLANNVSVIDTATNTVTTTIAVAAFPAGIAITPNGSTLYVASRNSVSAIDTSTNTVSTQLTLTRGLFLAVSPDGKSLYVPDSKGVQIANVANNKVIGTIHYQLPAKSLQVLFDPTGAYAWVISVAKYNAKGVALGGILRVNTTSLTTEKCVWGSLLNPASAAIAPNGSTIYIGLQNQIAIFNTATKTITGNIPITSYEGGVTGKPAVTPDGAYLYFPMRQNILVINTATGANAGIPVPLFEARFLTIAPNGTLAYAGDNFGSPNSHGAVLAIRP